MKTVTRTERVGEELGPIDWGHPWIAEMQADPWMREVLAGLREYDAAGQPDGWRATDDGGWPACGFGDVERLVMWDGWPYWAPHPVAVVTRWYGATYVPFRSLTYFRRKDDR